VYRAGLDTGGFLLDHRLRECKGSSCGQASSFLLLPDEVLIIELRERQQAVQGRTQLRERVAVEHTLAHVGQWQERRARYRDVCKNLFDLRRCACCSQFACPGSLLAAFS
jgi:hypothetical protein